MESTEKNYTESDINEVLSITGTELRKYRKDVLIEGEHYFRGLHNKVLYTESGYNKILEYLGARTEISDSPIEVEVLYPAVNRNLLICALDDGREIPVRVKDQLNFLKGMKIRVKKDIG